MQKSETNTKRIEILEQCFLQQLHLFKFVKQLEEMQIKIAGMSNTVPSALRDDIVILLDLAKGVCKKKCDPSVVWYVSKDRALKYELPIDAEGKLK